MLESATKHTVAIADDHALFADGIASMLSTLPNVQINERFSDGKQLCDWLRHNRVDLVLMDFQMPVMDGLQAMKVIQETHPEIKVLMLSMHGNPLLVQEAMKLGARGFLMKSADKEEFQLAVQKILAGGKYFSSELMEKILSKHSTESSNPGETQLTEREIEIVREVAAGLSSQEIADKLFISVRTVETHRKNIMSKLDVKNMAGLVRFALVNGLISN